MNNAKSQNLTVGEMTVSNLLPNQYKEEFLSAEIRQVYTTVSTYPSKQVSNSLNDSLYPDSAFGNIENQEFTSKETRVGWINVPEGTTETEVQAQLDSLPGKTLKKILSNHPILSEQDMYAIANMEETSIDRFANTQVIRYGTEHEKAGQLILDSNGFPQYRRIVFSKVKVEDEDKRTADVSKHYLSPEITQEFDSIELETISQANMVEQKNAV